MKAAWPSLLAVLLVLGCQKGDGPELKTLPPSSEQTTAAAPAVKPAAPAATAPAAEAAPTAKPAAAEKTVKAPAPGTATKQAAPSLEKKPAPKPEKIRRPAVAGLFYPADKAELTKTVDGMLAAAKDLSLPKVRALICPHAGYEYSGKTAALAYRQVSKSDVQTVVLLGPSHTSSFVGAAVADAIGFETPLGMIRTAPRGRELAALHPFTIDPNARIRPPEWSRHAPLKPWEVANPHTWEHSLEVQLPFIQRVLPKAQIVPVVMGEVDPIRAARILANWIDDKTLIVVSTDLSHYESYDDAKKQDAACIKAICDLDPRRLRPEDACGSAAVQTLIYVAQQKKWKPRLLEASNSGDTAGGKSRVVGYAAIAFCDAGPEQKPAKPKAGQVSADQRKFLLKLARDTLVKVVNQQPAPEPDAAKLKSPLTEDRACFVTLTRSGQLRGCIGCTAPEEPLYKSVIHKAEDAALKDHRFPPVSPAELTNLNIEISVLTVPKRLEYKTPEELLKKLRPNVDGVLLKMGDAQSVFLPQVWEQVPDKEKFMNNLARKAGRPEAAWREPGTEVYLYQVEAFKEGED